MAWRSYERLAAVATKPPPLLLAAGLLLWGWQTDLLKMAALMAVILESARLTGLRWEFSDDDFARLWTFCTLLFLGTAVYAFTANEGPSRFLNFFENPSGSNTAGAGNASAMAAAAFFRWLPMTFFLFVAAQAYSSRNEIPMNTISLIMRLRWKRAAKLGRPLPAGRGVNVSYPYFAICLFSASIHEPGAGNYYFWGLCALVAWALWTQRSRRFGAPVWAATMAGVVALGFFGQYGIAQITAYISRANPNWSAPWTRGKTDPHKSETSFGKIGRLKLSSAIVIRVEPEVGPAPQYLREASYRAYSNDAWLEGRSRDDFEPVSRRTNAWTLLPGKLNMFSAQISAYLDGGGGLLPLPDDCGQIQDLAAWTMFMNSAGTVKVEGPGLVIYDALYGPGPRVDSPAEDQDSFIPAEEEPALKQIAAELDVSDKDFRTKLQAVNAFFEQNFTYSTWLENPKSRVKNETQISRFLLRSRRGHCEYFATATALLLRELGIPTRYAVGYSVHEKSGKGYVVRGRDAHAWCLVWNAARKNWQDFDTTPEAWIGEESKSDSSFQWLFDGWSWVKFQMSKFRWGQARLRFYLIIVLVPVMLVLLAQIFFRRRRRRSVVSSIANLRPEPLQGEDSEFYLVERRLAESSVPRMPTEPLSEWLERVMRDVSMAPVRPVLRKLLQLHYRCRFDPRGLTGTDRQELKSGATTVLNSLKDR